MPVGLYYTEKTTFRSSALLYFGEPLPIEPVVLNADGTPPRPAVRELSDRIEKALREVILHAEQEEALSLIGRAEKIFSAEEVSKPDEEQRLTRSLELRQRFLERSFRPSFDPSLKPAFNAVCRKSKEPPQFG